MKKLGPVNFKRSGRFEYLGEQKKIGGKYHVKVLCHCGVEKFVNKHNFNIGKTKSCGCLKREIGKTSKTHGDSQKSSKYHNLYRRWSDMKTRCYNEESKNYDGYGAKGISVCDKWRNSYTEFKEWALKNGYEKDLTIDRIDYKGDYQPNNCRWVNVDVQANNKSNNLLIEIDGVIKNITEWSNHFGLNPKLPRGRYTRGVRGKDLFSNNKRSSVKWSDKEIKFLLDNWSYMDNEEIAEHLGRSLNSIKFKAYENKLSFKTNNKYKSNEGEEITESKKRKLL